MCDFYLESQYTSKYKVEYSIDDVYTLFLEEVKNKYRIENREDIYRIISPQDKNEVYIFRIHLDSDDKLEKRSFTETNQSLLNKNIKHMSSNIYRKSAFSSFSVFDEAKQSNLIPILKNSFINIEFFGLQKPSNKLVNLIGDLLIEKRNIIKLKKCNLLIRNFERNNILKELNIEYKLTNSEQKTLLENSQKIYETANLLFYKAKASWTKLFLSLGNNSAKQDNNSAANNHNNNNNIYNNALNTNQASSSAILSYSQVSFKEDNNNDKNFYNYNSIDKDNRPAAKNNSFIISNNSNNSDNYSSNSISNTIKKPQQNDSFNDIDLKLIYEFSDKIDLLEVYPAFDKISNISKNFSEDMIEYFKILKNNQLLIYEKETTKVILIPEQNQYCFYITVIK